MCDEYVRDMWRMRSYLSHTVANTYKLFTRVTSTKCEKIPFNTAIIYASILMSVKTENIWATSWQNQQTGFAPSDDLDQPGHPPSLIRVFAVHSIGSLGPKVSSCGQRRLWSDWADAQADLSLRWAHSHFVGFVMRRLIWVAVRSRNKDNAVWRMMMHWKGVTRASYRHTCRRRFSQME